MQGLRPETKERVPAPRSGGKERTMAGRETNYLTDEQKVAEGEGDIFSGRKRTVALLAGYQLKKGLPRGKITDNPKAKTRCAVIKGGNVGGKTHPRSQTVNVFNRSAPKVLELKQTKLVFWGTKDRQQGPPGFWGTKKRGGRKKSGGGTFTQCFEMATHPTDRIAEGKIDTGGKGKAGMNVGLGNRAN